MTYLLDTNVVSELRRRRPDANVLTWYSSVSSKDLYLSALTVGEIRLGIERLRPKDPSQATVLEQWLDGLRAAYRERVVDIDSEIAEVWGRLNALRPLPVIDSLLAATAVARGWTLVTRNTTDLAGTGARLLNPFD